MRFLLSVMIAVVVCGTSPASAQSPAADTLPEWWIGHVDFMSRGGGVWRAPNPAPDATGPEAIGMVWTASNERHVLTGRLYLIQDGCESREVWTFREFYHPGERRVVIEQWGGPGAYGQGETTSPGAGLGQVEMTLWLPDGRAWREGHRNVEDGDEYVTESFDIGDDGAWTQNGRYVWRRQGPDVPTPCPAAG